MGPIAKAPVRRAAERIRDRHDLCKPLADVVPGPARARLLADLARLT